MVHLFTSNFKKGCGTEMRFRDVRFSGVAKTRVSAAQPRTQFRGRELIVRALRCRPPRGIRAHVFAPTYPRPRFVGWLGVVVGCFWSLVVSGCWSLVVGCFWLLVAGCWLLLVAGPGYGCFRSFLVCRSPGLLFVGQIWLFLTIVMS